jgi:hypothetical protein
MTESEESHDGKCMLCDPNVEDVEGLQECLNITNPILEKVVVLSAATHGKFPHRFVLFLAATQLLDFLSNGKPIDSEEEPYEPFERESVLGHVDQLLDCIAPVGYGTH